jgi:hypothetical protein
LNIDYTAVQAVAAALLASGTDNGERTNAEQRKFIALLKMLRAGLT